MTPALGLSGRRQAGLGTDAVRALAAVGVGAGVVAIWADVVSPQRLSAFSYSDDGTVLAFLIVTLGLAAGLLLAGQAGFRAFDAVAAAAGGAAFGFYLFVPAVLAFERLGDLGPGGWLGICAVLVPLGAGLAAGVEQRHRKSARGRPPAGAVASAGIGVALVVSGIWLDVRTGPGSGSYWDASTSGHALGILMLALAALCGALLVATASAPSPALADATFVAAAVTFGLVESELVADSFGHLGTMGAGAWLEAAAGLLLLLGAGALRHATHPSNA
jgi:hypothetical protein